MVSAQGTADHVGVWHLQKLMDVVSDVVVDQRGVERLEVSVVDALKDQARCL